LTADGKVLLRLRRPWRDGTHAIRFEPSELLEKLAVVIPRPRINLLILQRRLRPARALPQRPGCRRGRVEPPVPADSSASLAPGAETTPAAYVRPTYFAWADLLPEFSNWTFWLAPIAAAGYACSLRSRTVRWSRRSGRISGCPLICRGPRQRARPSGSRACAKRPMLLCGALRSTSHQDDTGATLRSAAKHERASGPTDRTAAATLNRNTRQAAALAAPGYARNIP
jgi:hypothetical protein